MIRDLTFALRRLRQAPVFTAFAVVTLALSIGIVTAAYTLVRAGLQMDLGLADADRLVIVAAPSPMTGNLFPVRASWPDYQEVASQTATFEHVAAWSAFTNALAAGGSSEFVTGEMVSGNYFDAVGIRPLRGRLIRAEDDTPGAARVAVLSASVWRSRFNRNPNALGSVVKLGGQSFEIVGIVPSSFGGLRPVGGFGQPDIWVPLASGSVLGSRPVRQNPARPDFAWLMVAGRLRGGGTKANADVELGLIAGRMDEAAPLPDIQLSAGGSVPRKRGWRALGAGDRVSLTEARDVFRVVLMIPALVLLVACTNLANFALSRGIARQNEFGVRLAIGASRWQLIRSQLVEHAVVATAGGAAALLVANRLLAFVASTVRTIFGDAPQYRVDARIDGAVIVAVGLAALLSLVIAGLVPALQLTRGNLRQAVATDQATGALPRWRGRSNLIALQVSVSVALLLVAALCVRQLPKLTERTRSGISLDRLALVNVPFTSQSMAEPDVRRTLDRLLDDLRPLSGAMAASASSDRRFAELVDVAAEGRALADKSVNGPSARVLSITPAYFRTVGLRLVAGRSFDDRDADGAAPVAILNESQARRLFGTADVVGRQLSVRRGGTDAVVAVSIIGVAADTHDIRGTRDSIEDFLYVPLPQRFEDLVPIEILARAADGTDPAALARLVRDVLRRVNPDVAVAFVGRADTAELGPRLVLRYFTIGFGALAFLALGFAMSGLYGVLGHIVARRTRELGIRAALGADPTRLIRLILKDGSRPVLEGVILGFAMAAGARVGMQPWFTEPVTAVDPVALVIALVPLVAAAALACYLPARQAAKADPNVALRHL